MTVHLCEQEVAERRMIFSGAGSRLSTSDVYDAFMSYPDAVVLQGDIPAEALTEAARLSKTKELPLFLLSLPRTLEDGPLPVEDCEILSLDDVEIYGEIEEDGKTFEENALIKARQAATL